MNPKSSQNRPKIDPKSTPNRPKTASWRGHRFFIILGSILDPFLDPFWLHFRIKTCSKNTSNSQAKSIPKILFFCVVLATFWSSILVKIPSIFKTFRKHPFRTSFSCVFATFSIRRNLKNHCFPAGKHVFP